MTVVGVADGAIERLVVQMEQSPGMLTTPPRRRVPAYHETVEKLVHLASVANAGKGAVLAADTDAGVQHDRDEKGRLPFREAEHGDLRDAFGEGHQSSSSAT